MNGQVWRRSARNAATTWELTKGKMVVFFALPGAFKPTCSGKHVPGYLEASPKLKAADVDETVCLSVITPTICCDPSFRLTLTSLRPAFCACT